MSSRPNENNGFTKVQNQIIERLTAAKLNGTEYSVVLCIIRRSWGYQRDSAQISLDQFAKACDRHRNHVAKALKMLSEKGIIARVKDPTFGEAGSWKVCSDQTGVLSPNKLSPKRSTVTKFGDTKNGEETVTKFGDHLKKVTLPTGAKEKTCALPRTDPRYKPLVEFLFESYLQATGLKLNPVFGSSDGKAIKAMLQACPDIDLETLQGAWVAFLCSDDDFVTRQHGKHPARYWATNINSFLLPDRKRRGRAPNWDVGAQEKSLAVKNVKPKSAEFLRMVGVVREIECRIKDVPDDEKWSRTHGIRAQVCKELGVADDIELFWAARTHVLNEEQWPAPT